jgi:hypothetical protein
MSANLPASMRVEDVAAWLNDLPLNEDFEFNLGSAADAVIALVEAKVREAIRAYTDDYSGDIRPEWVDAIVSRVLSSPLAPAPSGTGSAPNGGAS